MKEKSGLWKMTLGYMRGTIHPSRFQMKISSKKRSAQLL